MHDSKMKGRIDMILTFLGATHEVTGSCFYLEACGKNILIDCGMEQGEDTFENQEIPIPSSDIDAVLLTHAHIDHSGRIPLLYAQGFRGEVHATGATRELCNIMLQDSAHIQESEAEWKNRKAKRSGDTIYSPIYDMEDAKGSLRLFKSHSYKNKSEIFDGITIRFIDAGHLLGSASIEVWVTEDNITKKIVFSGDIGNLNQPLISDPQLIHKADYLVMESTYGDRNHGESADYVGELTRIMQETFDRGGNLVIPSFAIGRTQVLLYFIRKIKEQGLIKGHDGFNVYMDSPMAIEATEIFRDNMEGYFDGDAMELIKKGINPIKFPGLVESISVADSKAINFDEKPKVIISASGMCDAGRIRHHLKHNLWREDSTILFVGYQANSSLGGMILNGIKEVKLFGEVIEVNAKIEKLTGVSGHADRDGLFRWVSAFGNTVDKIFVVHGESRVCTQFAEDLEKEYKISAIAPFNGAVYDLKNNEYIKNGALIPIKDGKARSIKTEITPYERLLNVGRTLVSVIKRNKGMSNSDIVRFTNQIKNLIDKWEK